MSSPAKGDADVRLSIFRLGGMNNTSSSCGFVLKFALHTVALLVVLLVAWKIDFTVLRQEILAMRRMLKEEIILFGGGEGIRVLMKGGI